MTARPAPNIIEVIYLIATRSVHPVTEVDEFSDHGPAWRVGRRDRAWLLAIGGTLLNHGIVDYNWIAIALVLGAIIGVPLGLVQMTAVPQRTALSHAFGAFCVTLVGTAEFYLRAPHVPQLHDGGACRWKLFSARSRLPAA